MSSASRNPFSDEINPYSPPAVSASRALTDDTTGGGLWRDRDTLIMRRDAQLPMFCVMSNEPATQTLRRKLHYLSPWFILLVVISLPIFLLVSLIATKKHMLEIGLTDEWIEKRRARMFRAWGLGLVGLLSIGLAILLMQFEIPLNEEMRSLALGIPVAVGVFLALSGLLLGNYGCRLIYASKIDDAQVWIKGVHPDFLDRLPVWPGT